MRVLAEIKERNLIDSRFFFNCLQTVQVNIAFYLLFLIPFNENDLAFFPDDLHKLLIESKVDVVPHVFFLRENYVHFLFSLFKLEDDIEASDAIQWLLIIHVPATVSL